MSEMLGRIGRGAGARAEPEPGAVADRPLARLTGLLNRPLTSYYLIIGCTVLLLAIGLPLVLSTSLATALDAGQSPFAAFQKQLLGTLGGLLVMWLAARASPRLFRAAAYPMIGLAVLGLLLVPVIGVTIGGATRAIEVAGLTIQPSEFAKLAFALWGADLLARKEKLRQLTDARQLLIPLMPGAGILALLVEMGHDIGSTCVLMAIFLGLLWVVGCPRRVFFGVLGLMLFGLIIVILTSAYARSRLQGFLSPATATTVNDAKWQYLQGRNALGSGGLFGVGLGASRGTWGWVSESSTDFIFAILGEELGLVGTLSVVLLYGGIAYAGIRVARRMTDTFMRLAAAAVTIWIVFQALINIGAVLGLVPITGIPLPLVSEGLSSLLVTMAGLGMLLSFARHEPGAEQALAAAGPSVPRRILSWLGLGVRSP
ncbi:MAG TPA: putative peptidoglycan glycosyltransferase FtsW [Streptosporangiaceae bacterium]|nr:putative peptidoglycan glycosyltransferase FtsW [Streptosporangiaceae bacterium]